MRGGHFPLNQFSAWFSNVDQTRLDGLTLAVVDHHSTWEPNWVRTAADLIRRKTSARKRFLRVVFVADPRLSWEWTESGLDPSDSMNVREMALQPWREAALRRWMEDAEFGAAAVNEGAVVLEQTGGWGLLIHSFGARCRGGQHGWKEHLETLLRSWPDDPCWRECHDIPQAARAILKIMAQWDGPISVGELTDLAQSAAIHVPHVLLWADRMSYARADGADGWRLNPLVRSLALAARD